MQRHSHCVVKVTSSINISLQPAVTVMIDCRKTVTQCSMSLEILRVNEWRLNSSVIFIDLAQQENLHLDKYFTSTCSDYNYRINTVTQCTNVDLD